MPKYTFECNCGVRFSRTLKMGEHKKHPCPSCKKQALRKWQGQGFGMTFAEGAHPGNSGVSKLDYPTADNIVGRAADARWAEIHARNEVKDKVRKEAGTHALIRQHGQENGQSYTEYTAMSNEGLQGRKRLGRAADRVIAEVGMTETPLSDTPKS